jgi:hypothetical protein
MDVTAEPVLERRRRLTQVISEVPGIQLGGYVEGLGKELFPSRKGETWRRRPALGRKSAAAFDRTASV